MTQERRQQNTAYQMPYVAEWEHAKGALRAMVAMRGMIHSGPVRYEEGFVSPAERLSNRVEDFIQSIEENELHYMPYGE